MATHRSQAFRPGRYIPLARITGAEILADQHPVAVEVGKTTIHGRAPQIFAVGIRMIRVAMRVDPRLAAGLAAVLPELPTAQALDVPSAVTERSAEISSLELSRGDGAGRLYGMRAAVSVAATAMNPREESSSVWSQSAAEEGVREVTAGAVAVAEAREGQSSPLLSQAGSFEGLPLVAASSGAVGGSAARVAD